MINLACQTPLKENEARYLIKSLHMDKELVFHIDMTPNKFPDLLINNKDISHEILICMNNTATINRYYDELTQMKLSTNLLEAFTRLMLKIELPQDFTRLFLKNVMS
jgi:hypothetical protein